MHVNHAPEHELSGYEGSLVSSQPWVGRERSFSLSAPELPASPYYLGATNELSYFDLFLKSKSPEVCK